MDKRLILYISMSLDGYIAKLNDDLSFLSIVEHEGEDYGYHDFLKTIDTVVIGRKTYDKVLSMGIEYPNLDKKVYVISRTPKRENGNLKYYTENLKDLILQLKNESGSNIYCDGGAEIVNELLKEDLIDEFIISVIPVILGDGVSLFRNGRPELRLKLVNSKSFHTGLVQLHYVRINN